MRKCMEVSLDVRTKRRWQFHACLCDLSAHFRASGNGDGTFQTSPLYMYEKLSGKRKWKIPGIVCLIGNIALIAFYSVVAGWIIYYFVKFLTGQNADLGFEKMITTPSVNVGYLLITVVITFVILSFRLQGGLERITKYMMSALLVLMLVLAIHSFTLSGAKDGLAFYLIPDLSKISGTMIVKAMNQAFFTLSVGMGGMAIFGSYIGKERSLLGESVNIIVLDTFVAVVAGMIMFPACDTYNLEVTAGPSLLFDTMASRADAGGVRCFSCSWCLLPCQRYLEYVRICLP